MPFSRPAFTGFPFDDSDFDDRGRSTSFRDTLDDIAKRHPEFAEHLNFDNKFPFRSNTWGHKRRGSGEEAKPRRFAEFADHFDRPSSSRFKEKFGFPFNSASFDETECCPERQETSAPKEQKPEETAKPPQVPTSERGRRHNPNLPQSSTVDLGQKQEPVCETRGQRSMSAPPENRSGQRFVSSINIPINTDGANEPQGQQQAKPNERVIPIHVEGRDEPVLPKNVNQTFSQTPPQNERVFGQKPAGFGSWKRNESPYYTGESYSSEPYYEGRHQFFSGHPQQRGNAEHFPNTTHQKQQQQQQQQQHTHKPQTPPPAQQKSATPPPQPPPPPSGPISQIQCIQRDVLELMGQVERFNGQPKDKEYVYLDEMLTRNLLKLDNIDTEGKENIRHARKEAINCIQKCISILEAKALANEQLRNAMEVDTKEAPLTSLEVSGVSRSGSETVTSSQQTEAEGEAPMEESADVAVAENKETDVEAAPATGVEMEVQEETPKDESEVVEEKPAEESVESSQEAPKATKKKVKKKEKSAE